jgi:hypothetical protein
MMWGIQPEPDFIEGLKRYGMTGRLFSVVDENGDTHTLRVAKRPPDSSISGEIVLFTDKGLNVQRVSKGVYKLSDGVTTIRATSDAPDAP